MLITIVPGLTLAKRGYRNGSNLALNVSFICVAVASFSPWCNMWQAVNPTYYALGANPWYYLVGLVCLIMAIRGLVVYLKLPAKGPRESIGK